MKSFLLQGGAIVLLLSSLCIAALTGYYASNRSKYVAYMTKHGRDAPSTIKLLLAGLGLSVAGIMVAFAMWTNSGINPASIKSEADAFKFIEGTWVYTGPIKKTNYEGWQKITFLGDGTAQVYHALPTEDGWGKPETVNYKLQQKKYGDTGERYWEAELNWMQTYVIRNNGHLRYSLMDGRDTAAEYELTRGDKNPFK